MSYDLNFLIRDVLIGVLAGLLVWAIFKIKQIKRLLAEEKRKRLFPLLMLEVDTDEVAAYLMNDSYCYAKNVKIDDLNITVDYGFKKRLLLKFEPIDMIKPGQKMPLNYRVWDGAYDITSTDSRNLVYHFSDSNIEMHISYSNMEHAKFSTTISRDKDQYIVKEVKPLA